MLYFPKICLGDDQMIIDIHTHTFPDKIANKAVHSLQEKCHTALFADGTEACLHAEEENAGVDLAVVQPVATYPQQVPSINNHVIARFGKGSIPPKGLLSFAAMHQAYPEWEAELDRIVSAGIPGIKIHPPYTEVDMDDPRTIRILKRCRDLDLIVLIHSGWDVGLPGRAEALPQKIRSALDAVGPMKLIAGHMAGWQCWKEAARLLSGTGIWLDTAVSLGRLTPAGDGHEWKEEDLQTLTDDGFCEMVQAFGADRVLFGTDSPWADPAAELNKIRSMPLSPAEIEAICGKNAARLLGLTAE